MEMLPAGPAQRTASGPHIITTTSHADTTVAQQRDTRAEPQPQEQVAPVPVQQRLEMARLAQEVRDEEQAYAKRPRRKHISANTAEYDYAAYMKAWVDRIERIGNLNYPDEARRRQLHGELMLTVGLARDGRVMSVDVIQSSGHRILDDAAIRIVHLAAPFPPIPHGHDRGSNKIDELYITRTWQFLRGDELQTR